MKLHALQSAFERYLFHGDNEAILAAAVCSTSVCPAEPRLDVYRNAYYIRLQEALANNFPVLLAVLGDAAFGRTTAAWLKARPSRHFALQCLGTDLADWLREQDRHTLADLAALEWAILRAFDAADAAPLPAPALADMAPESWSSLSVGPVPSLRLLSLSSNADACWMAHVRQHPMPPLQPSSPQPLVVWRAARGPAVQRLTATQYAFLQELTASHNLEAACERLRRFVPTADIAGVSAAILLEACQNGWLTLACPSSKPV